MQLYMLGLAALSARALYKQRMFERFGRVQDMLGSDLSPPVSIVVPAYNESVGIVESIRSMAMVTYPKFEIVVVNDGSKDDTLERMIEHFKMLPLPMPFRPSIKTEEVRQVYHARLPVPLTLVDKANGGRADALNAGINVARYPYVLLTDADVLIDGDALVNSMRHVAEDRTRTVGVGGNVRPLNGSHRETRPRRRCRTAERLAGATPDARVRPFVRRSSARVVLDQFTHLPVRRLRGLSPPGGHRRRRFDPGSFR